MKSIRIKILILVITCMLIVGSVVSFFVMQRTEEVYTEEIEKTLVARTRNNGGVISDEISDVENTSSILHLLVEKLFDETSFLEEGYMDDFLDRLKPSIKDIASELSLSQSAYIYFYSDGISRNVWYADLYGDGEVSLQQESDVSIYDIETDSMDWFNVPRRTLKPYWTHPYVGNTVFSADVTFVSHTRPIVIGGKFYGVVGSDYHFDQLLNDVDDFSFYEDSYAFLMDKQSNLISDTVEDFTESLDYSDRQKLISNQSGLIVLDDKYVSFSKLSNGWIYGEVNYMEDVYYWYRELGRLLSMISIILLVVILLMTMRLSSVIIDPIKRLTNNVSQISDGIYNKPLEKSLLTLNNEIGKLARSIEKLRLKQKTSLKRLNEQNETMEIEVTERTEDLVKLKEQLEISLEENQRKKESLVDLNIQMELAINKMKNTQLNLIESEKSASLSLIVTRMAHDFNTPIGSFLTLITFMKKTSNDLHQKLTDNRMTKADLEAYFDKCYQTKLMIDENLNNIRKLVERFSNLDSYNQHAIHTTINVKDHIVFLVANSKYRDDLEVVLDCPSDLVVTTDVAKFSTIIMNLVENAYFHAYDEDHTKVEIYVESGEYLKLVVKDFGKGITEDRIHHIFVPYFAESLNEKGSGLGLNIVYNIVTKYFYGTISCKSELGQGTEFNITLKL
ncbi:HAMP domain-containing protein [Acidaminobacter sp. JC074]|uniref:ATP-binding response regulator n=1 Tax=Acidaminobacter sp. JC074 TaxID=2530199 RepID=UPI001F10D28E|nr:ATP-binding protein [Acidaminobacter sp. JC074]MCH4888777.1 HAMP domain-containing protein [Acidaminobacter sp. JC074]